MDKGDRTGSSVRLVGSSGAGVGASAMVVSVGAGWERLADMMRVAGSTYTWRSMEVLHEDWTRSSKKIEKGYFGNLTKYRLGYLLPTRGARRCVKKRIRSGGDEDDALKCVRV